ncbi:MAG TPA: hypothetical protein VEL76_19420 [Gemmataceae bacterium]|nr:hypothetical protein [Gemmataceae bacterium]
MRYFLVALIVVNVAVALYGLAARAIGWYEARVDAAVRYVTFECMMKFHAGSGRAYPSEDLKQLNAIGLKHLETTTTDYKTACELLFIICSLNAATLLVAAYRGSHSRGERRTPPGTTPLAVEEPIPADETSEPAQCLACSATIPSGKSNCPSCGWTYRPVTPKQGAVGTKN